jgi:hypothetical protein
MSVQIIHPYVRQVEGVAGGKPVGAPGPRCAVSWPITEWGIPRKRSKLPHLSLAQIYDALSFYYDYRAAIDADSEANREEYVRGSVGR